MTFDIIFNNSNAMFTVPPLQYCRCSTVQFCIVNWTLQWLVNMDKFGSLGV